MNKYKKILVIFFIGCLFNIIIYCIYKNDTLNIFIIKDNIKFNYNSNDTFILNDKSLTYGKLYQKLYYNDRIYYKGKYTNINELIASSDYIIISLNNHKIIEKCSKNKRLLNEYLNTISNDITKIINHINNIRNTNIIIMTPKCINIDNNITKYKNVIFTSDYDIDKIINN